MLDFFFNWVIGLDPFGGWGWAGLGVLAVILVRYLTGSWKATFAILTIFGAAFAMARARKAGQDYHERKVEKENAKFTKESQAIEKREAKRTPAARRKRGSRFVHDD